jgi:hypothetical protein
VIYLWSTVAALAFFVFGVRVVPECLRLLSPEIMNASKRMAEAAKAREGFDEMTLIFQAATGAKFISLSLGIALNWAIAVVMGIFLPIYAWPIYFIAAMNSIALYMASSKGIQYRG